MDAYEFGMKVLASLPAGQRAMAEQRALSMGVTMFGKSYMAQQSGNPATGMCPAPSTGETLLLYRDPQGIGTPAVCSDKSATGGNDGGACALSFGDWCSVRSTPLKAIEATSIDRFESDYSWIVNFSQLIRGVEFMELTAPKLDIEISGIAAGPALVLLPVGGILSAGISLHWSLAAQLTQPADVVITMTGWVDVFGGAALDRTVRATLSPRTNGGWVFIPHAFRSATEMDLAAFQLGVPFDGPSVSISGSPVGTTWTARELGPFNTWTAEYVQRSLMSCLARVKRHQGNSIVPPGLGLGTYEFKG